MLQAPAKMIADKSSFLVPYILGSLTGPLVATVIKPLMRGAVKTTIGIGLQVKKLAAEAAEELQDLAAEAGAERAASDGKPATAAIPAGAKKA
jgi:hypothetical protein